MRDLGGAVDGRVAQATLPSVTLIDSASIDGLIGHTEALGSLLMLALIVLSADIPARFRAGDGRTASARRCYERRSADDTGLVLLAKNERIELELCCPIESVANHRRLPGRSYRPVFVEWQLAAIACQFFRSQNSVLSPLWGMMWSSVSLGGASGFPRCAGHSQRVCLARKPARALSHAVV
jgi:hypothetical protein